MTRRTLLIVGAAVVAVLLGVGVYALTRPPTSYVAYVRGYYPTGDGSDLVLFVVTGHCDKITKVDVDETASTVTVVAHAEPAHSNKPECNVQTAESQTITIGLKAPLGQRTIIGETGNPLPQVTR